MSFLIARTTNCVLEHVHRSRTQKKIPQHCLSGLPMLPPVTALRSQLHQRSTILPPPNLEKWIRVLTLALLPRRQQVRSAPWTDRNFATMTRSVGKFFSINQYYVHIIQHSTMIPKTICNSCDNCDSRFSYSCDDGIWQCVEFVYRCGPCNNTTSEQPIETKPSAATISPEVLGTCPNPDSLLPPEDGSKCSIDPM